MARTRKRAIVASTEMKQRSTMKSNDANRSSRSRAAKFHRRMPMSSGSNQSVHGEPMPSTSSGSVQEVLIKLEEDDEQDETNPHMESDVVESESESSNGATSSRSYESSDMRMNVAPALTCSSFSQSGSSTQTTPKAGTREVACQTYPTVDQRAAESVKVKSHLKEKLECPVCSRISLPPIMQCRNGHITCNVCRLKVRDCPVCRESDTDIRNLYAEKSIHFLSIPCEYKNFGCKEEIQFSEKEMHENNCKFRPFNCPYIECEDKLAADDVVAHVTTKHVDEFKNSDGPEITASMILTGAYFGGDGAWSPRMISCFGKTFFDVALTRDRSLHHWVWILGEEEVAQEYVYEITAFKGNIKYMYGGEVSSLRIPDDDIVTFGKCLSINDQVGKHLRDENKIRYKLKLMKAS